MGKVIHRTINHYKKISKDHLLIIIESQTLKSESSHFMLNEKIKLKNEDKKTHTIKV